VIVQPRVIARTREIVRAVVEVRRPEISASDVVVSLPSDQGDVTGGKRIPLTAEDFFEKLAAHQAPATVADLRMFLEQLQQHGIESVWREGSVSLMYREPHTGSQFSVGSLWCEDGAVDMQFVPYKPGNVGLDDRIAQEYLDSIAALVPDARVQRWRRKSGHFAAIKVGQRHVTLTEVLPRKHDWLAAIDPIRVPD